MLDFALLGHDDGYGAGIELRTPGATKHLHDF